MRWLAALVLASWSVASLAQTIDVRVYDAFGGSYDSTSIGEDLGAVYNIGFDPVLVIILAGDMSDERLAEQRRIVRTLDPDETGVLYALGTPMGATSRGYTVSANSAAELLPEPDGFRVLVLNSVGAVRIDSTSVLDAEAIIAETPAG
jgi:hypothetical protein